MVVFVVISVISEVGHGGVHCGLIIVEMIMLIDVFVFSTHTRPKCLLMLKKYQNIMKG